MAIHPTHDRPTTPIRNRVNNFLGTSAFGPAPLAMQSRAMPATNRRSPLRHHGRGLFQPRRVAQIDNAESFVARAVLPHVAAFADPIGQPTAVSHHRLLQHEEHAANPIHIFRSLYTLLQYHFQEHLAGFKLCPTKNMTGARERSKCLTRPETHRFMPPDHVRITRPLANGTPLGVEFL